MSDPIVRKVPRKKPKKHPVEITNFYELEGVQAFAQKYHNPCYDEETMPLKHPMYMLVCGSTGSGKTNILMNIIKATENTFNFIRIFTQNKNEPLYLWLESVIEKPQLIIYEGLDDLKNMDIEKLEKAQYLFIFDDQCLEHDQDCIEQLYIRGRKLAQGSGISSVYLSQSYFATPPLIRKQINYLVLKKINGTRDLNSILKECSIAADKKQMMKMFNYCVQSRADICNFLLIDLGAQDDKRFRKNFSEILDVNQF